MIGINDQYHNAMHDSGAYYAFLRLERLRAKRRYYEIEEKIEEYEAQNKIKSKARS